MSPDELHQRYIAEIDHRAVDDRYIDGIEERELLQLAIQHGFGTDWGRRVLTDVCQEKGYIIEAKVIQRIRESLRSATRPDGTLDRAGFNRVVEDTRQMLAGTTLTLREIQALVMQTLEDAGTPRIRKGLLFNWYNRLKKQVGGR